MMINILFMSEYLLSPIFNLVLWCQHPPVSHWNNQASYLREWQQVSMEVLFMHWAQLLVKLKILVDCNAERRGWHLVHLCLPGTAVSISGEVVALVENTNKQLQYRHYWEAPKVCWKEPCWRIQKNTEVTTHWRRFTLQHSSRPLPCPQNTNTLF